jgi:hypothetical protein
MPAGIWAEGGTVGGLKLAVQAIPAVLGRPVQKAAGYKIQCDAYYCHAKPSNYQIHSENIVSYVTGKGFC